jgi:ligand-binding sensor domain-containing protein
MVGKPGCSYYVLCLALGLISGARSANAVDPASAFAEYTASTWTHRDGLRSTFIRSIVQTADGYIWLGTTDGLFRFVFFSGTRKILNGGAWVS